MKRIVIQKLKVYRRKCARAFGKQVFAKLAPGEKMLDSRAKFKVVEIVCDTMSGGDALKFLNVQTARDDEFA